MHDFDPTNINFRCVGTWWLLGDITRALALSEFESFEFEGSIHRQHAVFAGGEGGGGNVWVNRPGGGPRSVAAVAKTSTENWLLPNGLSLPPDGFYAETPGARAGIVEIAGRRCAFSQAGTTLFVDGRPNRNDGTGPADTANATALADFAALGIRTDGAFRLARDGDKALLLTPIPDSGPFRAEINLAVCKRFVTGVPSPAVVAVEPVDSSPDAILPDWKQKDGILSLSVDSKAFAYRIAF